ncbi:MAG: hypothetical protein GY722_12200 [bacterium]|nr:hypothetical protein [bacterium]
MDTPREHYEQLRDHFLLGSTEQTGAAGERFARLGLAGLFDLDVHRGNYVVETHEAKAPWTGRVDSRDAALRDVVWLVLGNRTPWADRGVSP